jgi:hypothetical protein
LRFEVKGKWKLLEAFRYGGNTLSVLGAAGYTEDKIVKVVSISWRPSKGQSSWKIMNLG